MKIKKDTKGDMYMLNGIELIKSKLNGESLINSIDVAQLVDREHSKVLRDLSNISNQLNEAKIGLVEYFQTGFYTDKKGEARSCVLLTKKGCELYATRMTGTKGTKFAATYINVFNEMENAIKLDSYMISDPVKRAEKWIEEEKERLALVESLEQQKPKVLLAESIENSHSLILVGELAKILKQNGFDIGQNRLYERLRDMGYLVKSGASKNSPTQLSMELGLFRVVEGTRTNDKGVNITKTTKVTGKGQKYFVNKFLKEVK